MKLRVASLLVTVLIALLSGCSARTSTAYLEIENDQAGVTNRAEPIYVAPGVEILQNEYRRSSSNDGSNIIQKIKIKGPIMIIPAPAPAAATRPAIPH